MPSTGLEIKTHLRVNQGKKKKKKAVGVQANPAGASAIESWLRAVRVSDF